MPIYCIYITNIQSAILSKMAGYRYSGCSGGHQGDIPHCCFWSTQNITTLHLELNHYFSIKIKPSKGRISNKMGICIHLIIISNQWSVFRFIEIQFLNLHDGYVGALVKLCKTLGEVTNAAVIISAWWGWTNTHKWKGCQGDSPGLTETLKLAFSVSC